MLDERLPTTLGFLVGDWIAAHIIVPTGFKMGKPFIPYDDQLRFVLKHYEVKKDAPWVPDNPILGPSFSYQNSQLVRPQKWGKGPLIAALVANEAVGPSVFCGFAAYGDKYKCIDHGCYCGFVYSYDVGEPMGIPHPSPMIQITAFSVDQTDNIYKPLQGMIRRGPLGALLRVGEGFIKIPGANDESKIEPVTSSALSRLGNPITFAVQDETGVWTKSNGMEDVADAQLRGLGGMSGRSIQTTNAWDKTQNSVAQKTFESNFEDVYTDFIQAPSGLDFTVKEQRFQIYRTVYGDTLREFGGHIDLNSIDSTAVKLMAKDLGQAERFYGNRLVQGLGAWLKISDWDAAYSKQLVTA